MQEFLSDSESKTKEFAKKLASRLVQGSFLAVYGDLGAGKTAFVKGLAQGLGVTESIVSPTYTILRVYETGRVPLYHFDVYRIADEDELYETGFDEYAAGDGVCVCEWADLIPDALPIPRFDVRIERLSEMERKITLQEVKK
ncbi:tRNA (adenosine(37)-N6)-threonylcarbamoyltransferase complex ATPase subunit type 1 TsaE [Christensenella tenuis]|jgi:tRNA threonylcarbamoyladenosine biosynthesis protein TsaE|uniref:tRNA threonylcarbamoyladenosine biosynthesis protein TsaE n=1 Tax=Christensenella tenuis TaxID=2763033 RepID=A0ABR7EAR1_9FIRM|nr:tRNA (adenosine(37)-N6)-threonylcarbamoyltransferase complex ATPase subunit type 1 TsaE [Christensenella tenuis]MBC5646875.1 tRNA (adenosine(37)-N6)-threonylcarbamoyltransferase complex ATPase subunit type 1 TsaE [Christensenella tenuis]